MNRKPAAHSLASTATAESWPKSGIAVGACAHVRARGISSRWAAWAWRHRAVQPPAVGVVSCGPRWQPDPAKCSGKAPAGGCLSPASRLIFGNDVGRHAAAVLDVDALLPGPGADCGGVDGAGGAAAGGSPGCAAGLAGVIDVFPHRRVQFFGVLSGQVDFIAHAVEAEPDGACSLAAVDVVDVEGLYFLNHEIAPFAGWLCTGNSRRSRL